MNIVLIQILIVIFIVFAVVSLLRRFLRKEISLLPALGWLGLWLAVAVAVLIPQTTEILARFLGVGRGVDVVLYLSVVFLFYLQFRTLLRLERTEQNITKIVRSAALKDFINQEEHKDE